MGFAIGTDTAVERVTKGWKLAVAAGILGWVLDAFDFFIMVFLFDTLAGRLPSVEDFGGLHPDFDASDAAVGRTFVWLPCG